MSSVEEDLAVETVWCPCCYEPPGSACIPFAGSTKVKDDPCWPRVDLLQRLADYVLLRGNIHVPR